MAKTAMPLSRTSEAATSSCVESGFEAHSTTSAPPSRRQMARLAVSAVTCRQAEIRTPFNGWFLMNSLRMICSTFIDWFAHSMRFFPMSARSRFLSSQFTCVGVVDIPLLIYKCFVNPGIPAPPDIQNTRNRHPDWLAEHVGELPEDVAKRPLSLWGTSASPSAEPVRADLLHWQ